MSGGRWRAMTVADLAAVEAIADAVHVAFPEDAAIPRERLALFPAGCRIAEDDAGTVGYCVAHPWRLGRVPPLDTLLGAIPADADCLYIHDVAILPRGRGDGLGSTLCPMLVDVARAHRLATLALTAVSGSAPFWRRNGFSAVVSDALATKLRSYGEGAIYMTRPVDP